MYPRKVTVRALALIVLAALLGHLAFGLGEGACDAPLENFAARLAEPDEASRERPIRVAFYGQSIMLQDWWNEIAADIERRFPGKRFEMRNFSVGGHGADRLVKLVDSDILPFQPDIVFFHAYGPPASYEALIRKIRLGTVADIVIATDHLVDSAETDEDVEPRRLFESDWLRAMLQAIGYIGENSSWIAWRNHVFLPRISARYGTAFIDVRSAWRAIVRAEGEPTSHYLVDDIHLNQHGNQVMYRIYRHYLDRKLAAAMAARKEPGDSVLHLALKGGTAGCRPIELRDVYRVALRTDAAVGLNLKINGVRPDQDRSDYWISRPSNLPGTEWPGLLKVGVAPQGAIMDSGRVELVSRDAAGVYRFRVFSEKQGFQGEGRTDEDFHAERNRVTIRHDDWNLKYAESTYKIPSFVGARIEWTVMPGAATVSRLRPEDGWVDVFRASANRRLDLCIDSDWPATLEIRTFRAPFHCVMADHYCHRVGHEAPVHEGRG